jgi:hypothetical protein
MRRSIAGLAVLALTLAVTPALPAAATPFQYCAEGGQLPAIPDSEHVQPTGAQATDPSGRYQVSSTLSSDVSSRMGAWIWHNGVGSRLIPLTVGYLEVNDVNVRGETVGMAYSNNVSQHGWRIRSGKRTELPQPPGVEDSRPLVLNASGEVAGNSAFGGGRAVAWAADDTARVLAVPAGYDSTEATDLDEDGVVVGTATKHDESGMPTDIRPVAWATDGDVRVLPTADNGDGSVKAVRNGIAVGGDSSGSVRWDLSTDARTVLSTVESSAVAVNAGGDILTENAWGEPDVPTIQFLRKGQPARGVAQYRPNLLTDSARVYAGLTYYECG